MNIEREKIRVRFAPSPTGFMHVGNARTAIFNDLFAKSNEGELILRIEDTDVQRNKEGAEEQIINNLKWLGVKWTEGPDIGGKFGPYRQSERTDLYEKAVRDLLDSEKAYRCFCSVDRLESLRKKAAEKKVPFHYDGKCREVSKEESDKRANSEQFVVRLKTDLNEPIIVKDLIKGDVRFETETIDDFVVSRGYSLPIFHLAVVVDDAAMQITHVIRGEDHLSNTPKHILLQRALNLPTPFYAHLPLLLDEKKHKLSKRAGGVDLFVETLRKEEGYLSEALANGLALLGWNSKTDQEIFSYKELENIFNLNNIQKSGAVFSVERLKWINKQHLKKLTAEQIYCTAKNFVESSQFGGFEEEKIFRVIEVEKERISLLKEIPDALSILIKPTLIKEKIGWKDTANEDTLEILRYTENYLRKLNEQNWNSKENLHETFLKMADESGKGRGPILWPLRYVLSGKDKSAGPDEIAWILGKEETLERTSIGIKLLENE